MLLLLMACLQPLDRSANLPRFASAAVVMDNGSTLSLAIALDQPHEAPRTRYAWGLVIFDGMHLAEARDDAFIDPLDDTALRPSVSSAHIPGPGHGFTLTVEGGALLLTLPNNEDPFPILLGVDHAVALYLLTPAQIDPVALERVEKRFKAVGPLRPRRGKGRTDGDLSEWEHQPALAMDESSWILEGDSWWKGPRDAAMALASRLDGDRLRVAVRIRDDDLQAADEVEVQLGWIDAPYVFGAMDDRCAPPDCVTTEIEHGVAFELAFPIASAVEGAPLPVRVSYHDRDGYDPETVLANTPDLALLQLARSLGPGQALQ